MKRIKERIPAIMIVLGIILLTLFGIYFSYEDSIIELKEDLQTSYNTISVLKKERQECEYYIVKTDEGFIIDGCLYKEVEDFKTYE